MDTCVGTRVSTHESTRVGAFTWDYNTEKANFVGTLLYTCVNTRVSTCGSPFVGALVGQISLSPALCFIEQKLDCEFFFICESANPALGIMLVSRPFLRL